MSTLVEKLEALKRYVILGGGSAYSGSRKKLRKGRAEWISAEDVRSLLADHAKEGEPLIDEDAEAAADKAGAYGAGPETGDHPDDCKCRICFIAEYHLTRPAPAAPDMKAIMAGNGHPDEGPCVVCGAVFDTHNEGCVFAAPDALREVRSGRSLVAHMGKYEGWEECGNCGASWRKGENQVHWFDCPTSSEGKRWKCKGCGATDLSEEDGIHGTHLNYDKHELGDWCGPVEPAEGDEEARLIAGGTEALPE